MILSPRSSYDTPLSLYLVAGDVSYTTDSEATRRKDLVDSSCARDLRKPESFMIGVGVMFLAVRCPSVVVIWLMMGVRLRLVRVNVLESAELGRGVGLGLGSAEEPVVSSSSVP